jgi:hypothetical protein
MITPAEVKTKFPEFTDVDDTVIQSYIDDAYLEVNEARAGRYYEIILYYLIAHYIALSLAATDGNNRGSGLIASMAVGDTSIGFSTIQSQSNSDFYYQQTQYGLRFLRYQTFCGGGGLIV